MYQLPSDKEPILTRLTTNLTLAPDASIDLHMHTTYSDGRWHAEQLINYLVVEGFDLVSITDHDSVDTVASVQQLRSEEHTSELQSQSNLVCRLLLEKQKSTIDSLHEQ